MANEVYLRHTATGVNLYFTIRNVSRQMWNTAGTPNFETLAVANWGDYDVVLTESPASSYFYHGTFPAISGNMVAGWYFVEVFLRAGGSPAISDSLIASYFGYWDGTTFKFWSDDVIQIGGTTQTPRDIGLSVLVGDKTGFALSATGLNSTVLPAGFITAVAIAASALDGKGNWNIGKTGYDLVAAWNAAKTAAQAGDQMNLVNAPNATALTAIGARLEAMMLDEGDATALLAAISAKVEQFLINEGDVTATLQAIATAVWANITRSLTDKAGFSLAAPGPTVAEFNARTRLAAEYATSANQTTLLNRTKNILYHIDEVNGVALGDGTPGNPVNTLAVALDNGALKMIYLPRAQIGESIVSFPVETLPSGISIDLNGGNYDSLENLTWPNGGELFSSGMIPAKVTGISPVLPNFAQIKNLILSSFPDTLITIPQGYFHSCYFYPGSSGEIIFGSSGAYTFFYYCVFGSPVDLNGGRVILNFSTPHIVQLEGCYGNIEVQSMANANDRLEHYGYGKLVVAASCTSGKIIATSHVEIFESDGVTPFDHDALNRPIVELVSEVGTSNGTGLNAQETRDAMKLAPSAGASAELSIDDELAEIKEQIALIGTGQGAGAFEINVTIKDADSVIITDCDVILTTSNESPRTGVYARATTNVSGIVTFYVDTGTLYVWRQKGGVNFSDNPLTMVIDVDGDVVIS